MSSLPRCRTCGDELHLYEGERYCPTCSRYTLADDFTASTDDPILMAERLEYEAFAETPEGLLEWVRWTLRDLEAVLERLTRR